jgi:thiol-disulfide isomerase/thioredoxin
MYRLIASAMLLALALVVAQAADDKKDEKKSDKAETPKEMFQELIKQFRATKDKDKQQEVLNSYNEKFLSYGEKHKDEDGAKALLYVLQIPAEKNDAKTKAVAILKKDHARTTKLGKVVKQIPASPLNNDSTSLLKDIAEHNKDKATRAYAYRALIKQSEQAATFVKRLKGDEDLKERFEKARGKDAVKAVETLAASSEQNIKGYQAKLDGDLKGAVPDITVGRPAPEVVSQDLDGKQVKLSQLRGKVVVLDFWATWCGPCRSMIPHTRELVKKMEGKPFVFVSVSADAKKETLTKFIKDTPMPWTHWWAGNEKGVVDDWDIEAFPTIVILDAKGVIRKKFEGANDKAVDEEVEKLVKETEKDKKTE